MTMKDLIEAIDDSSKIISMERIARRYFDRDEKVSKVKYGDDILVVMEVEEESPKEIRIYDNVTGIKIRPFVEPVRQCFNCFKYGHIKSMCKNEKRCIICASKEHGRCQKEEKCISCGENHRSTSTQCKIFIYNRKIKVIMAENKIGIREATKIIDEEERKNRRGWETSREIIRKEKQSRIYGTRTVLQEISESAAAEKRIRELEKELERERRRFEELIRKEKETQETREKNEERRDTTNRVTERRDNGIVKRYQNQEEDRSIHR